MSERIEFEWNGETHYAVLKKLTFGEMNDIWRETVKIKIMGTEMETTVDWARYRELLILKSIKEASFKATIDTIRNLPHEVGEMLFAKAQELNPFLQQRKNE